ncbi:MULTISPECIES: hypothetical protein [Streptomyces]|uniref:Uncharacterized protein n=2 Tax=Streptomyces TaxID=1883 RepID=A0ABV9IPY9_9ACTN
MFDAEITFDAGMPTDTIYMSLSVDQTTVYVTLSPKTRNPHFLALLEPSLRAPIVDAHDGKIAVEGLPPEGLPK